MTPEERERRRERAAESVARGLAALAETWLVPLLALVTSPSPWVALVVWPAAAACAVSYGDRVVRTNGRER